MEKDREEQSEKMVKKLMEETKLWRAANSAMWIAWGIVQAKVPGMEDEDATPAKEVVPPAASSVSSNSDAGYFDLNDDDEDEEMGLDEFDYLRYAQDRAFFFWGDMVRMGLVSLDDLPEMLKKNLKIVEY